MDLSSSFSTNSISYNCRMVWVERDLKDHLIPTPHLAWTPTETSSDTPKHFQVEINSSL